MNRRIRGRMLNPTKLRSSSLSFETLESRCMLTLGTGFEGIDNSALMSSEDPGIPPDPVGAVGLDSYVHAVNRSIAIYDKSGAEVAATMPLSTFFGSVAENADVIFDPIVVYNDSLATPKFAVGALEGYQIGNERFIEFYFAISTDSSPATLTDADWDFYRYDVNDQIDASGQFVEYVFADFPKIGFNADGFIISFLMFVDDVNLDHVSVLGIQEDGTDTGMRTISTDPVNDFVFAPASQHGASPGDPIWFVQDGHRNVDFLAGEVSDSVTVVRLDNPFSEDPVDAQRTVLATDDFYFAPLVRQPTPGALLEGKGGRFFFADLRDVDGVTHLVAAMSVGVDRDPNDPFDPAIPVYEKLASAVQWFDFNVTSGVPTLIQDGTVNADPATTDTFLPSIAIAPDGTIGLNYLQSGSSEFMSMQVTAHRPLVNLPGEMHPPIAVKTSQYVRTTSVNKVGDYSFLAVDPEDGTFWAVNEYAKFPGTTGIRNWGTWIQQFDFTPPQVVNLTVSSSTAVEDLHPPYSFADVTYDAGTPQEPDIRPILGTGLQLQTIPVGGADTVAIRFSEQVKQDGLQDRLRLVSLYRGAEIKGADAVAFDYDEQSQTATWRFDDWMANDQFAVVLDDAVLDLTNNPLDGEWTNPARLFAEGTTDVYTNPSISTFPSGDGDPGGDFAFILTLLAGDANRNNIVEAPDDGFILVAHIGIPNRMFTQGDFNGDGVTDPENDGFMLIAQVGYNRQVVWLLADLDGDDDVDEDDLALFDDLGTTREEGDLDGDGDVDQNDYDLFWNQYGTQPAADGLLLMLA